MATDFIYFFTGPLVPFPNQTFRMFHFFNLFNSLYFFLQNICSSFNFKPSKQSTIRRRNYKMTIDSQPLLCIFKCIFSILYYFVFMHWSKWGLSHQNPTSGCWNPARRSSGRVHRLRSCIHQPIYPKRFETYSFHSK